MTEADTAKICSPKKQTLQSLRGTLQNCLVDTTKLYNGYYKTVHLMYATIWAWVWSHAFKVLIYVYSKWREKWPRVCSWESPKLSWRQTIMFGCPSSLAWIPQGEGRAQAKAGVNRRARGSKGSALRTAKWRHAESLRMQSFRTSMYSL